MRAHLFYSVAGLAVSAAGVLAGDAALYMYPAAPGPGRPARVSPAQANRILSHHLDVPGEHLTQGAHDRDSWDFLQVESNSGTAQDLFDDAKNRLVVVVHGAEDAGGECLPRCTEAVEKPPSSGTDRRLAHRHASPSIDVAPSSLRQTHSMPSAPPAHSFDALIHSYGERLHSSLGLGQHKGFLGQSVEAIEEAAEWFAEKVMVSRQARRIEISFVAMQTIDERPWSVNSLPRSMSSRRSSMSLISPTR